MAFQRHGTLNDTQLQLQDWHDGSAVGVQDFDGSWLSAGEEQEDANSSSSGSVAEDVHLDENWSEDTAIARATHETVRTQARGCCVWNHVVQQRIRFRDGLEKRAASLNGSNGKYLLSMRMTLSSNTFDQNSSTIFFTIKLQAAQTDTNLCWQKDSERNLV